MIVRLGMAPRNDGTTAEDFQRHWRTSHADVVSTMPGLRRYVQLHAVLQDGAPVLPHPGFDACSALTFDDLASMDAAFDSATFRDDVVRDEQEFVDKTRFLGVVAAWRSARPSIDALGPVVTASLWRLDDPSGSAQADLVDALAARHGDTPHGFLVTDRSAHEGRFAVPADVVELVGHPDVAGATRAAHAADPLPGATCVARHLARPVVVVGDPAPESSTPENPTPENLETERKTR